MNTVTPSSTGYVISDMHIFGCTSLYEQYLPTVYAEVARHPITVLYGDTFDFKRSLYTDSAETTRHALVWLHDLAQRATPGKIFYILGNHDSQKIFARGLTAALPKLSNVSLVIDSLRLGSALFVHGDIVDLPCAIYDLTHVRSRYEHVEPSWTSRIVGHAVTRLGINKLEYLRHSKAALAEKIVQHFTHTAPDALEGVADIYFGHTHVPFTGFQHRGITFHNTGSMIRGLPWHPLEFAAPKLTQQP